jgi:GNAT superfamily N-acetyltransferase
VGKGERPAGYPHHLEQKVMAGDRLFTIRPILPADAPLLAAEFAAADAETLRMRFLVPRPRLDDADFERLTTVDYQARLAITAWHGPHPAAIARYEPSAQGVAEVAFVVKAEHRERGLGRLLIDLLAAEARRNGYHQLEALYLMENAAAARSLAGAGFAVRSIEDGVVEAVRSLA